MTQRKQIIIVDDHPLFREGLKVIIGRSPKYEVVGEAGTAKTGLKLARDLKPDLALVDVSLPDKSGIELVRDILTISPKTCVMIVSMHSKIDYIVRSFQMGATGYLVKESAAEKLLEGMDHVLKGNYYMDTSVSQQVVKKLVGLPAKEAVATGSEYDTLTPREQEITVLLAEGLPIKQVAEKLFISPKTAENHRANIMRKLDLHSNMELIRFAAKLGLIDVDLWKE
ncbi:MAG: response regulator transcription factor [Pseudomonadota bacterium]